MFFTRQSSMKEIMEYPGMEHYLAIFFPSMFLKLVPKTLYETPLEEVEGKVTMPWGAPYLSDSLLEMANLVVDIQENHTLEFVPLWKAWEEGYEPNPEGEGKEGVSLFIDGGYHDAEGKRKAVLICPGGGYNIVAVSEEGMSTHRHLKELGYQTFVLKYRVNPNHYPAAELDVMMAMKYIRANAEKYKIDPENILLVGYSAGGHLVATEAELCGRLEQELEQELVRDTPELAKKYRGISAKPNKLCLGYAAIRFEKERDEAFDALTGGDEFLRELLSADQLVTPEYPKTYLWACEDDDMVPVRNTRYMGDALEKAGVEHRMRIFPTGGHGCSTGEGTSAEGWIEDMVRFME